MSAVQRWTETDLRSGFHESLPRRRSPFRKTLIDAYWLAWQNDLGSNKVMLLDETESRVSAMQVTENQRS